MEEEYHTVGQEKQAKINALMQGNKLFMEKEKVAVQRVTELEQELELEREIKTFQMDDNTAYLKETEGKLLGMKNKYSKLEQEHEETLASLKEKEDKLKEMISKCMILEENLGKAKQDVKS